MWLDELAVFLMMCCALARALQNREGRRRVTVRAVAGGPQPVTAAGARGSRTRTAA